LFFGSLHTEHFNACAIYLKESGEHLIVFESQLFFFLNRISKIIAACLILQGSGEDGYNFSFDAGKCIEHIKINPELQENFNDQMIAFICEGNVKATPNLLIPYPKQQFQRMILRAMELFIMGHEYTHVFRNHFRGNSRAFFHLHGQQAEEMLPDWDKEFEADSFGALIAISALNKDEFGPDFYLVGPDVYFALSEIIKEAYEIRFPQRMPIGQNSHPPSAERRANVRKAVSLGLPDDQFNYAQYLPDALIEILYYLWDNCKAPLVNYQTTTI
jgi:hypothetical protein